MPSKPKHAGMRNEIKTASELTMWGQKSRAERGSDRGTRDGRDVRNVCALRFGSQNVPLTPDAVLRYLHFLIGISRRCRGTT